MSAVLEVREPGARYLSKPQPLLAREFDLMVTAPGGVVRLRESILTLAVQGKLVPQDEDEESAPALLARIRTEKERLIAAGKVAREKSISEIAADEPQYGLPERWAWARLPSVCYAISPSSNKLPSSAVKKIGRYPVVDQGQSHIAGYTDDDSLLIRLPGPVIVFGDHTKNIKFIDFDFVAGADGIKILRPLLVDEKFFALQLRSYRLEDRGYARHFKVLNGKLFAVAPQAEQARIVARVEELMCLCDALQDNGRLDAEQHARLLSTLLGTLTDSASPDELATNWHRVAAHFDLLLDRPEAVDALEQTILQLAVRGLLAAQDRTDEPARLYVDRIDQFKAGISLSRRTSKNAGALQSIDPKEEPFVLPPGWAWTRFGDVAKISGGVTLGRKLPIAKPVSLPYLRVANVQRWRLVLNSMKDVVIDVSELSRYQVANGDLLITEGGDWDKVGRTAIWRSELPVCLHQNHVFKARGYTSEWNSAWAELFLNSDIARTYFAAAAKQTTNLASINMSELKHCVFPVPPLAEQSRIVSLVSQLRRVCAGLRELLATGQSTQTHLAEALVESAIA